MSNIEHVVIVMMENHSFDEYFGTFPNVAGFSDASPAFAQPSGIGIQQPWRASTFTSVGSMPPVLFHDWPSFQLAVNKTITENAGVSTATGDNMGFLAAQFNKNMPSLMSYYAADDIPYHWMLASNFCLCDQYFQSVLGPTFPNRMYLVSGAILANETPTTPGTPAPPVIYTSAANAPVIYNNSVADGAVNPTAPSGSLNAPNKPSPIANVPQSYLQTLVEKRVSYSVYDDWNWTFGWEETPVPAMPVPGQSPPPPPPGQTFDFGDKRAQADLNVFGYYPAYNNPPHYNNVILGTLKDHRHYRAANYSDGAQRTSAAAAAGDLRPLFAQHVNPLDKIKDGRGVLKPITWIYPPYNYSEHPSAHNTNTQAADGAYYLSQIVDAVINSRFWDSTVLIVVYDESNSHFDHVVPTMASSDQETWVIDLSGEGAALDGVATPIGAGPRVPAIIISPWTYRQGVGVIHDKMDHTSLLRLVEDVAGQNVAGHAGPLFCPSFPQSSWRRSFFADLGTVIANLGTSATPASVIENDRQYPGGLPTAATVATWRTNAQARYAYASQHQNQGDPRAQELLPPDPPQPWPPQTQSCVATAANFSSQEVMAALASDGTATLNSRFLVIVSGFEPDEFIDINAGSPPGIPANPSPPTVNGNSLLMGSRVPVVVVVGGANLNELDFTCSSMDIDPGQLAQNAKQGVAQQISFYFDVIFKTPGSTFAFRSGTTRIIDVVVAFTVDVTVTTAASIELTEGTRTVVPANSCFMLAEQLWLAEQAVSAAQKADPDSELAKSLLTLEKKLGWLQRQYAEYCGPGSSGGPPGAGGTMGAVPLPSSGFNPAFDP